MLQPEMAALQPVYNQYIAAVEAFTEELYALFQLKLQL